MKIFIDSEFRCHITNPNNEYIEVETDFFNDKCNTFIEGYCFEPGDDGNAVYPWKPYSELEDIQREYEKQLLSQYKAENEEYKEALRTLNVEV